MKGKQNLKGGKSNTQNSWNKEGKTDKVTVATIKIEALDCDDLVLWFVDSTVDCRAGSVPNFLQQLIVRRWNRERLRRQTRIGLLQRAAFNFFHRLQRSRTSQITDRFQLTAVRNGAPRWQTRFKRDQAEKLRWWALAWPRFDATGKRDDGRSDS